MKRIILCAVAAVTLAAPPTAGAVEEETTMPEVVVTATRTETPGDRVGGSDITVISNEEIEASKAATVSELLKTVPGIDIRGNGGRGTNTSINLRGADSQYTLILLDGIMYNDPSQGQRGANIGSLTTDNVDRIEIIRGPMSVLYGSNATAGVINIITRKGAGKTKVSAGIEGGSEKSWKVSADVSGKSDRFDYTFAASRAGSAGFSIADADNDRIPHAGNTDEKDGWKNTTLSTRLGFDFSPDFRIEAIIRHLNSTVDLDDNNGRYTGDRFGGWPAYAPEPDGLKERREESRQSLARINFHNDFFSERLSSDLALQGTSLDRDSFDNDGLPSYDYTGRNREASWQGTIRIFDANLITIGTGFMKEAMDSDSSAVNDKTAETISVWAQDQIMIGDRLDIVAGIRNDHHDRFGDKTTWRVAPALHLRDTTIKASYATGFRDPSLYELYSSYGNENLGAEKSEGYDLGVEQGMLHGRLRLGLTWFALNFDDRIAFDFGPFKYTQQAGITRTRGIEATTGYAATDSLDIDISYTYTDTRDPDGVRLSRRPLNKASLNATYRFAADSSINCELIWTGERDAIAYAYDKDGNKVDTLAGYTVVNLAGRYQVMDNIEVYGRIENLFDEYYEDAWSYASQGRAVSAGVKLRY